MFNHYELDAMLKDMRYLNKLDHHLKEKGVTIATATQSDLYSFITESHEGEIDYYTGKPVSSISYTEDMGKINDLICRYRKLKTVIQYLMENDCL